MTVTLTSLPNSFYPFLISARIGKAIESPVGYQLFTFPKNLMEFPSATWRHTWRDNIADAEVVIELAPVPDGTIADNFTDIAVDTIGRSAQVSYEVDKGGTISPNEVARATDQCVRACRRKGDAQLFEDTTPALVNEFGDALTSMTYNNFISYQLELAAQVEQSQPAGAVMRASLHPDVWRALVADMSATQASIFAAQFGSMQHANALQQNGTAAKMLNGIDVWVTSRIPIADGSGRGNVFAYVGDEDESCFGHAVKWRILGEIRAPGDASLSYRVIVYARWGFGILRQDMGLKAISQAA